MSEKEYALPPGWIRTTVGDISTRVTKGTTPTTVGFAYTTSGIRFVKVESLENMRVHHDRCAFISTEADEELSRSRLRSDDVLFSIAGTLGRVAVVRDVDLPANTNQAIAIVRPTTAVDSSFLALALHHGTGAGDAVRGGRGVGLQNLNLQQVSDVCVPLPPLNEQRRIVAKLNTLQERSQKAREHLEAVPPLLEKLRQSILASAFRGDLTKTWREQNKKVEPASELLKRIRKERRKKWEEAELAKMKAKGKAPSDDKWKGKYQEPEAVDASGLPELPEGWCWASPDELSAPTPNALTIGPFGSDLKVADYREEGIPLVFVRDIRAESFGGTHTKYVTPEKAEALARHLVRPGDLLITKMGDPPGDTAVYPGNRPSAVITADCIKLTPVDGLTDAIFLKYCLRSQMVRDQLLEQTAGVAQQKLSLERFRTICVPLPPREEQREIVARLEALNGRNNECSEKTTMIQQWLGHLDRAILSKAFRGELVPQDPKDEPALQMLNRLQSSPPPTKKQRKTNKDGGKR